MKHTLSSKSLDLTVIRRPMDDDRICIGHSSDNKAHIFGMIDTDKFNEISACQKKLPVDRSCNDNDDVCEICFTAAEKWALGRSLYKIHDS